MTVKECLDNTEQHEDSTNSWQLASLLGVGLDKILHIAVPGL